MSRSRIELQSDRMIVATGDQETVFRVVAAGEATAVFAAEQIATLHNEIENLRERLDDSKSTELNPD